VLAWLESCVSFVCFCRTRSAHARILRWILFTVALFSSQLVRPARWWVSCFANKLLSVVRDTVPFSHHHALVHSCCHHVGVGKVADRHQVRCAEATQHSAAIEPCQDPSGMNVSEAVGAVWREPNLEHSSRAQLAPRWICL